MNYPLVYFKYFMQMSPRQRGLTLMTQNLVPMSKLMAHICWGNMERFIPHIVRLSRKSRLKNVLREQGVETGLGFMGVNWCCWGKSSHVIDQGSVWFQLPAISKGGNSWAFLSACWDMSRRRRGSSGAWKLSAIEPQDKVILFTTTTQF